MKPPHPIVPPAGRPADLKERLRRCVLMGSFDWSYVECSLDAGEPNLRDDVAAVLQRLEELESLCEHRRLIINAQEDACESYRSHIAELEAIIAKHDLCHDQHGKVGRDEFEEGCYDETVKEFGSCGWADRIAELEAENERLRDEVHHWESEYSNQQLDQQIDGD